MKAHDVGLLVLRLAGFGLALAHGWGKVAALSVGNVGFVNSVLGLGFPVPVLFAWAAALTEFAGGLMIGLGIFTRQAAALGAVTMTVAAFGVHRAHLHFADALGIIQVGEENLRRFRSPELALVYWLIFVALALLGSGRIALRPSR